MALIVEDGTGKADAEGYVSAADADTYFTSHGAPAAWTAATTAEKEAAIRAATTYLDAEANWPGAIVASTQALGWPRTYAYDLEGRLIASTTLPQAVADATCELALIHLSTPLTATATTAAISSAKVGSLEVAFSGASQGVATSPSAFPAVWRILHLLVGHRGLMAVRG